MVANAKDIIKQYEASRTLESVQENPPSAHKREPDEDDLAVLNSDLTKRKRKKFLNLSAI
jgi:hypothetical protein